MSGSGRDDDGKLDALDQFMIEQILGATDAEIQEQAKPDDEEWGKEILKKAKLAVGKRRMAAAKDALKAANSPRVVVPFDRATARQRLNDLAKSNDANGPALTLAARGASGSIDDNEEGLLEDLLGLLEDDGGKDVP